MTDINFILHLNQIRHLEELTDGWSIPQED